MAHSRTLYREEKKEKKEISKNTIIQERKMKMNSGDSSILTKNKRTPRFHYTRTQGLVTEDVTKI